jgi:hypothetical protein
VARTGRLRDALPLLPAARRVGLALAWIAILLVPLRWLGAVARDAWLIAPGTWMSWLCVAALLACALAVMSHVLLALAYGGDFMSFLRPIRNFRWVRSQIRERTLGSSIHERLNDFFGAVRVGHHLRLAAFAYAAAAVWLSVPTILFTACPDSAATWRRLLTFAGGACLVPILMVLPLLEAQFTAAGRWRSMFDVRAALALFGQSPMRLALSTSMLYLLAAVPLFYCAKWKNELPPHETMWDVMFVFIMTAYPARVLLGWAYHRAQRGRRSWLVWRWASYAVLGASSATYVLFLFLVQTAGQLGVHPVWQHHALLIPFP